MFRMKMAAALLVLLVLGACTRPESGTPPTARPSFVPPEHTEAAAQGFQRVELAFVSDRRQEGNLDIWLFDLATEQAEPVAADDWHDANPVWSPDGQMLAFLSFEVVGPIFLRVVRMPDRSVHTLVPPEQHVDVRCFAWSGDSRSLFFATYDGVSRDHFVWQVDLETGERRYVTKADCPISVSSDGQYLALSVREPECDWKVFRVLRLLENTELQPPEDQFNPGSQAWSPDGSSLAVVSLEGGGRIGTYSIGEGGIVPQAIAAPGPVETTPSQEKSLCDLAWSPDGRRILAVRALVVANVCQGELLLYDADLAHFEVLPLGGLPGFPTWSPDGKRIAYGWNDTLHVLQYSLSVQKQASGEIWVVDSTGQNARPLITGPHYNGQPAWRP